jgi:hypothetical protein
MHDENIARNAEWLKSNTGTQQDMFTTTATDYAHLLNPTVTTCGTSTGYAYSANSLGLNDSTQA